MPKLKRALETSLDYDERQMLKKAIELECKGYQKQIDILYSDPYNSSLMMSKEDTKAKNEILRKIKFYKMKKTFLHDFCRTKK